MILISIGIHFNVSNKHLKCNNNNVIIYIYMRVFFFQKHTYIRAFCLFFYTHRFRTVLMRLIIIK